MKIRDKKWYPYTLAACIAVVLYVALTHLPSISGALRTFLGYFTPVLLGGVLAYLMNPLARLFARTVFKKVRRDGLRWTLCVTLTVIAVLAILGFMLGTLIPQLADSVMTLVSNMDGYIRSLQKLAHQWGVADKLDLDALISSSGNIMERLTKLLSENLNRILSASAAAGRNLVNWVIALILSVYLLAAKTTLQNGMARLLRALLPEKRYISVTAFLSRCHGILIRYIVFTLLDAAIVGAVNGIFMSICRMQYVGLVSMVVAITNLIPTFGPVIGGAIGGFVLLLVNPVHALIFIGFTMILQFLDGYVIKPKLFGDSLGVSGLLILISIIVCGNIFGIVGILLAIPIAAIVDFLYREELLPALEARRERKKTSPPTE